MILTEKDIDALGLASATKADVQCIESALLEKLRGGVELPEAFAHAAYKEQDDNREWIAGVKSGRKIVDRMVDAVIGKAITDEKPSPLPPESLFELWWAEYLPEATQARAFEAWSRVDAAPQPAQPVAQPCKIMVIDNVHPNGIDYDDWVKPVAPPLTDEDCTRIYNEANNITVKNPPISTSRIFAAMRAAHIHGSTT